MSELWPQGPYKGDLTGVAMDTAKTGTPSIVLDFLVNDVPKTVRIFLSDDSFEYAEKDLQAVEFSGNFENPTVADFGKVRDVGLYCKHEEYEGEMRERWRISTFKRVPPSEEVVNRIQAKWASRNSKPAAAPPAARPSAPPSSAPAWDKNKAWAEWDRRSNGKPDADRWRDVVEKIGKPEDAFTSADWETVAKKALPI